MNVRKKQVTRVDPDTAEFCTIKVELRDRGKDLELSICGEAGHVMDDEYAQMQAREYWITFFEDSPEELESMGDEFEGDPEAAANFVLEMDGEYHGLDVVCPSNICDMNGYSTDDFEDHVFSVHSCGQIRNDLETFFPEAQPYFRFHLNSMSRLCEHMQEYSLVLQDDLQEQGYDPKAAKEIADSALMRVPKCRVCDAEPGSQWWTEKLPLAVLQWFDNLESNLIKSDES